MFLLLCRKQLKKRETGSAYIDKAFKLGAVDYVSRPLDRKSTRLNSSHAR